MANEIRVVLVDDCIEQNLVLFLLLDQLPGAVIEPLGTDLVSKAFGQLHHVSSASKEWIVSAVNLVEFPALFTELPDFFHVLLVVLDIPHTIYRTNFVINIGGFEGLRPSTRLDLVKQFVIMTEYTVNTSFQNAFGIVVFANLYIVIGHCFLHALPKEALSDPLQKSPRA